VKAMLVVGGEADVYVHASGLYEWDVCAPATIAAAAGMVVRDLDGAEIVYRCSAPYDPGCEGAVRWDSCGIDWPLVGRAPILSPRDADAPAFADWASPFGGAA
ncbi:MAG: inositol monophosphatase family protein, partial [Gemmobacter sp.]